MKHSLRKMAASVSVTYSGGNFSNNLFGTEFVLEESGDHICLSINLAGNLSVRNKAADCYADACELAEEHLSLESIQIDQDQVVDGLKAAGQRTPNAHWELKLLLGGKGTFTYPVKPTTSNGDVFLEVVDV